MIESGSRFDGYFDSEFQRLSSIARMSSIWLNSWRFIAPRAPISGRTRYKQLTSNSDSAQGPHEKRLLNDLLSNYNVLERPVANESEPLLISFGLTLQQIIDVVSNTSLALPAIHC
ncbi:neur_chan_LBD domain-containing protein [Caerostris darwini]|uniref:Neur_chan_LBD domain-containing protein n=1 Tax=Caerostris darwini TaxID=1538125 RepID=A0AAV4VXW9_9ARAC|nr:neur_chan_LBD domain-containing protein [Caerostris darwini]